jgi:hypothetical protein
MRGGVLARALRRERLVKPLQGYLRGVGSVGRPRVRNVSARWRGRMRNLCQYHRTRGEEVCPSSLRRPVEDVDRAVVDYLSRNVLTEEVITDALKILRARLIERTRSTSYELKGMESEVKKVRKEIENLVSAIAVGAGNVPPLIQAVAERQQKLSELEARLSVAKTAPEAISAELRRLEQEARAKLADFRAALFGSPIVALAFLRTILTGRLMFSPEGNLYRFEGEVPVTAALFGSAPKYASPAGFEPALAT